MSKKIYITESQYKNIIGEMAYPVSFNFDEFKSLKSFAQRVRYCDEHLQKLGSGSSRIVYVVDNDKVLKLAKNKKGIAQNQVEVRLGTEPYYTCFAEIYEYDEGGLWVEMEYCSKAKKSDFKKIYGITFEVLCCAIEDMANGNRMRPYRLFGKYQSIVDEIWSGDENKLQELFNSVHDYIGCEGLEGVNDLYRISSWGINKDNEFVIIDYGLDDDVFEKFYRR